MEQQAAAHGPSHRPAGRSKIYRYVPNAAYQLSGRFHFTTHETEDDTMSLINEFPQLYFFSSTLPETYLPFCADFGPNNICDVVNFCATVRNVVQTPCLSERTIIYYTSTDDKVVTNTVFLLCCYLMLEEGLTPEEAIAKFDCIKGLPVLAYHDATWHESDFHLSILGCLQGLEKAMWSGFVDPAKFDIQAYEACYETDNYDMTKVTPKFVAFATPKSKADQYTSARLPSDHASVFREMGVTDVVRLSDAGVYDDDAFVQEGFKHHALEFEDCTCPSAGFVKKFLDICDAAGDGVVAVHCLAGLGRTGTLIACHMIKHQGFTAAEAIGFLRLMRPGSVIGPQQKYLERVQAASWVGNTPVFIKNMRTKSPVRGRTVSSAIKHAADLSRACSEASAASTCQRSDSFSNLVVLRGAFSPSRCCSVQSSVDGPPSQDLGDMSPCGSVPSSLASSLSTQYHFAAFGSSTAGSDSQGEMSCSGSNPFASDAGNLSSMSSLIGGLSVHEEAPEEPVDHKKAAKMGRDVLEGGSSRVRRKAGLDSASDM